MGFIETFKSTNEQFLGDISAPNPSEVEPAIGAEDRETTSRIVVVSTCCGEPDRPDSTGMYASDTSACPKCKGPCEFVESYYDECFQERIWPVPANALKPEEEGY